MPRLRVRPKSRAVQGGAPAGASLRAVQPTLERCGRGLLRVSRVERKERIRCLRLHSGCQEAFADCNRAASLAWACIYGGGDPEDVANGPSGAANGPFPAVP